MDDIPGRATSKPITIDRDAAISDNRIVAPKPFSRNLILLYPEVVLGSITYQPQAPGAALQPATNKMHARAIEVLRVILAPLVLLDLAEEFPAAF